MMRSILFKIHYSQLTRFLNALGFSAGNLILVYGLHFINLNLTNFMISILLPSMEAYFAYTFDRILISDKDADLINDPNRTNYILKNQKAIKISSIFCLLCSFLISILNGYITFIMFLSLLLLFYFYNIKKLPFGIKRLKDRIIIKNIVISLCWTIVVVITPVICLSNDFDFYKLSLASAFIFVYFLNASINGDILDIVGDKKSGINTIPISIGIKKTHILMAFIFALQFLILHLVISKKIENICFCFLINIIITGLSMLRYIYTSNRNNIFFVLTLNLIGIIYFVLLLF
jgi:4-hydroxybenzoate polyprenyltransferase